MSRSTFSRRRNSSARLAITMSAICLAVVFAMFGGYGSDVRLACAVIRVSHDARFTQATRGGRAGTWSFTAFVTWSLDGSGPGLHGEMWTGAAEAVSFRSCLLG